MTLFWPPPPPRVTFFNFWWLIFRPKLLWNMKWIRKIVSFETLSCILTKKFTSKSIKNSVSRAKNVCVTLRRRPPPPPPRVTYYLNDPLCYGTIQQVSWTKTGSNAAKDSKISGVNFINMLTSSFYKCKCSGTRLQFHQLKHVQLFYCLLCAAPLGNEIRAHLIKLLGAYLGTWLHYFDWARRLIKRLKVL